MKLKPIRRLGMYQATLFLLMHNALVDLEPLYTVFCYNMVMDIINMDEGWAPKELFRLLFLYNLFILISI